MGSLCLKSSWALFLLVHLSHGSINDGYFCYPYGYQHLSYHGQPNHHGVTWNWAKPHPFWHPPQYKTLRLSENYGHESNVDPYIQRYSDHTGPYQSQSSTIGFIDFPYHPHSPSEVAVKSQSSYGPSILPQYSYSNLGYPLKNSHLKFDTYYQHSSPYIYNPSENYPDKYTEIQHVLHHPVYTHPQPIDKKYLPEEHLPETYHLEKHLPENHFPKEYPPVKHLQEKYLLDKHLPENYLSQKYFLDKHLQQEHLPEKHHLEKHLLDEHLSENYLPEKYITEKYHIEKQLPEKYIPGKHFEEKHHLEKHLPDEHLPEKHNPKEYLIGEHLPEKYRLDEHLSEKYLPENYIPEKYHIEKQLPEEHIPGKHFAEKHHLEKHLPDEHLPDEYLPEEHHVEKHLIDENLPEKHLLDKHLPQEHLSEKHLIDEHFQEKHFLDEHLPQEHLVDKYHPEKHLLVEPLPEKHILDEHLPEKHSLDEHLSEEQHPEQHPLDEHLPEEHFLENPKPVSSKSHSKDTIDEEHSSKLLHYSDAIDESHHPNIGIPANYDSSYHTTTSKDDSEPSADTTHDTSHQTDKKSSEINPQDEKNEETWKIQSSSSKVDGYAEKKTQEPEEKEAGGENFKNVKDIKFTFTDLFEPKPVDESKDVTLETPTSSTEVHSGHEAKEAEKKSEEPKVESVNKVEKVTLTPKEHSSEFWVEFPKKLSKVISKLKKKKVKKPKIHVYKNVFLTSKKPLNDDHHYEDEIPHTKKHSPYGDHSYQHGPWSRPHPKHLQPKKPSIYPTYTVTREYYDPSYVNQEHDRPRSTHSSSHGKEHSNCYCW